MKVTIFTKYCLVVPVLATTLLTSIAAFARTNGPVILGVGEDPKPVPATSARKNPRDFWVGSSIRAALNKELYAEKARLDNIERKIRKVKREIEYGGGFIPSEVARYRQKMQRALATLERMKANQLQVIAGVKQRIRDDNARRMVAPAVHHAANGGRRTRPNIVSGLSRPAAAAAAAENKARLRRLKFEEDLRRAQAEAMRNRARRATPRPNSTHPTTIRPEVSPFPIMLPAPRPTVNPAAGAAAGGMRAGAGSLGARPTAGAKPRPPRVPEVWVPERVLPPGMGSIPLELVAPTYVNGKKGRK